MRPKKTGLDYFPFDVDFFEDEKMVCVAGEFGIKGELAAVKLLCAIYRNGYFIEWNETTKMKILRQMPGVSSELFDQILNRLVRWGFFDVSLFDSVKVLTSVGIQRRYFEITKRRKPDKSLPFLLLETPKKELLYTLTPINVYNNPVNVDINPQSKVNINNKSTNVDYERCQSSGVSGKGRKFVGGESPTDKRTKSEAPKLQVPYKLIMEFWNRSMAGHPISSVSAISEGSKRQLNVKARFKEHGVEKIYEAITKCAESKFLNGYNARGWTATFDWVFLPSNFLKVLDGNYQDRENNLTNQNHADTKNYTGTGKQGIESRMPIKPECGLVED